MLQCPRCRRRVPEVLGAPEQQCPHCRHAFRPYDAAASVVAPARPVGPGPRTLTVSEDAGTLPRWDAPAKRAFTPWDAVTQGLRVYAGNLRVLLVLWLPVLLADLAILGVSVAWLAGNGLPDVEGTARTASPADRAVLMRMLGFALPLYMGLWIMKLVWWGVQAPLVRTALEGGHPTVADGVRVLRARWPALLATGSAFAVILAASLFIVIAPLVYVLTLDPAQALGARGFGLALFGALFFIPFVIFVYWYLFAPAAASADGATLARAFRGSHAFARSRRTLGFTAAVLVLVAAGFALTHAASAAGGALAASLSPTGRLAAEEGAAAVARWILAPVSATVVAAYWFGARMEPRADAAPTDAEEAPAPAPAAEPPQARLKTTRCPGCTTVFPYAPDPEGKPVRVECPTCGKKGLIR